MCSKFDVGIYTVITSVSPLRVYVFDGEALLRFCPEDYYPFVPSNVDKYVIGDDYTPTWEVCAARDTRAHSPITRILCRCHP
jgi:tubulin monoglycylase TTLL15